jgi:hypothetical protein
MQSAFLGSILTAPRRVSRYHEHPFKPLIFSRFPSDIRRNPMPLAVITAMMQAPLTRVN